MRTLFGKHQEKTSEFLFESSLLFQAFTVAPLFFPFHFSISSITISLRITLRHHLWCHFLNNHQTPPPCPGFNPLLPFFPFVFTLIFYVLSHFLAIPMNFFLFFMPTSYLWHCLYYLIFVFIFLTYFVPITAIAKVPREQFKKCDNCWNFAWFLWFFSWLSIRLWYMDSTFTMSLFHQLMYRYIDGISPCFDSSHTTFPLLPICANWLWAHYLGFCLHPSISICLARSYVMWLLFASSHSDFNQCTLWFYFFWFNFWIFWK